MPNQIAILRVATGRLALFVNGHRSDRGGQGQLALLASLLDNLGRVVAYKRLFTVIGRKSDNGYNRHLLRQYMLAFREMLLANKAPFVIATVQDIGYALCEIAENPHLTLRTSNDLSHGLRFPPPWSVEETDACFIVRDADGRRQTEGARFF